MIFKSSSKVKVVIDLLANDTIVFVVDVIK